MSYHAADRRFKDALARRYETEYELIEDASLDRWIDSDDRLSDNVMSRYALFRPWGELVAPWNLAGLDRGGASAAAKAVDR